MKTAMNDEELMMVNGGNWFTDAWDATCNFVSEYKREVIATASLIVGAALCATGAGAAVGVGLIGGGIAEAAVVGGVVGGSASALTALAVTD